MATEKDKKYTGRSHDDVILPNEPSANSHQNEERHNSLLLIAASLILLILLFAAVSTARTHEDTERSHDDVILPNEPSVNPAHQNEERHNEEKRVFIRIKDNKSDKKIRAQSTSNVQDRVKDKVGRNKIKYDLGNYISASINEKDLEILKKDYPIEVYPVPILKTMLQTSPNIINATPTYLLQESALNLTGQGQTVCVIDTGINYSHPALGGCYGNNNASSTCKVIGGWDYCADNAACNTRDSIPEDVAEEVGRNLSATPLLSSAVLAVTALVSAAAGRGHAAAAAHRRAGERALPDRDGRDDRRAAGPYWRHGWDDHATPTVPGVPWATAA